MPERHVGSLRWLSRLACDCRVQLVLGAFAVALAVCVGAVWGRRSARRRAEPPVLAEAHPIWDSWRAAAAGDVAAYLRCFVQEAREGLDAKLAQDGREAFRGEIRAAAEAALGIELGPPKPSGDGGLSFPVTVAHKDDAELFDYVVVRVGSEWKIRAVVGRGRRAASPPYRERLGPPAGQGGQR